jgi:hypothetical protein
MSWIKNLFRRVERTPLEIKVDSNFDYHNAQYESRSSELQNIELKQINMFLEIERLKIAIGNNGGVLPEQTPIFGFGATATGGEGQTSYVITNLNDSGVGSLRDAISQGDRYITFNVSGYVTPTSEVVIPAGVTNLTIDGSTAPNGGVGVRNFPFRNRGSNVIIKHLRFRLGDNGYKDASGTVVGSNSADSDTVNNSATQGALDNLVYQNCSFSWSIDELMDFYAYDTNNNITNVTVQDCLFSEALWQSHHSNGGHAMGMLIGGVGTDGNPNISNVTLYRNMFAHMRERLPSIQGGSEVQVINNLMYNFNIASEFENGCVVDFINNHYKGGNNRGEAVSAPNCIDLTGAGAGNQPLANTRAYISGNTNDIGLGEYDTALNPYLEGSAIHPLNGINVMSIAETEAYVLANVGATLPKRDSADTRAINDYINGTGDIIDTQSVYGYPDLTI